MSKIEYFQIEYLKILSSIDPNTRPVFGKMNVHQMIEHMSYAFRQASGLISLAAINDEETTQKMFQFMMSDKPFRDNTPNPYLPKEPAPAVCPTIQESISVLEKDIKIFFETFVVIFQTKGTQINLKKKRSDVKNSLKNNRFSK